MRIALVGPGRAGTALVIAFGRAGHDIVAVAGRDRGRSEAVSGRFGAEGIVIGDPIPPVDLILLAVRDDAIHTVAKTLASTINGAGGVVHLSGATSVEALGPIAATGVPTGSFHPLQLLPTPETGADQLDGAWIAVTAAAPLRRTLHELAESIGAKPFDLDDPDKAIYHAAAAAASNFSLAALAISQDLFEAAGVPFAAAQPLVDAGVANAFEHGAAQSLTGPVARGDVSTVEAQLAAIEANAPRWHNAYRSMIAATADVAGTAERFEELP